MIARRETKKGLFNTKVTKKVQNTKILRTVISTPNSNKRTKRRNKMRTRTILNWKRSSLAPKRKTRKLKLTHSKIRMSSTSLQTLKSRKAIFMVSKNMINLDSLKTIRMSNSSLQIREISKASLQWMPIPNNWLTHNKCKLKMPSKGVVLISIKRSKK